MTILLEQQQERTHIISDDAQRTFKKINFHDKIHFHDKNVQKTRNGRGLPQHNKGYEKPTAIIILTNETF